MNTVIIYQGYVDLFNDIFEVRAINATDEGSLYELSKPVVTSTNGAKSVILNKTMLGYGICVDDEGVPFWFGFNSKIIYFSTDKDEAGRFVTDYRDQVIRKVEEALDSIKNGGVQYKVIE